MQFARKLRQRIVSAEITCSIRIWQNARVKTGGRYKLADGHIHVTSVREIEPEAVTDELARISGFEDREDLFATARHGRGENVYLIEFHYVPCPA
ncbi:MULTISPECIES: hypothetical protein [unclassified Novosphingobium]|uniref:hypothetical protein n=1 Tax=unclassified Novosphingobium TaxID=2644732 RepID=UPI0025D60988|nr:MULTISPECIES: hypothetical protein [unclassified Novosphingobium]HQV03231.1 hypothetical protein [Novosphingobium sp.]